MTGLVFVILANVIKPRRYYFLYYFLIKSANTKRSASRRLALLVNRNRFCVPCFYAARSTTIMTGKY